MPSLCCVSRLTSKSHKLINDGRLVSTFNLIILKIYLSE